VVLPLGGWTCACTEKDLGVHIGLTALADGTIAARRREEARERCCCVQYCWWWGHFSIFGSSWRFTGKEFSEEDFELNSSNKALIDFPSTRCSPE